MRDGQSGGSWTDLQNRYLAELITLLKKSGLLEIEELAICDHIGGGYSFRAAQIKASDLITRKVVEAFYSPLGKLTMSEYCTTYKTSLSQGALWSSGF